jgi:hypothetical protein
MKAFASAFVTHYAPVILESYQRQIGVLANGGYLPPRIRYYIAKFLDDSVMHASMWKILKPWVPDLMRGFVLSQVAFTDEDEELWADDPQQYLVQKFGS